MSQSVLPAREDGVVRIEALDGLRGVAAIVVVLYHALLIVPEFSASIVDGVEPLAGTPEWALLRTPLRILVMGPEAVLIFFVLSGFVLTLGFVGRPMSSRFVGSYLIRRVLRLYIPVWGSLIFAFVLALAVPRNVDAASSWLASHPDASIGDLLKDGLLLLGTSNLNSPLWSLVWEVWFSLLLPVIWLVFRVARVERWWIGAVLLLLFLSFLAQFPEVRAAMPVSHVTGGLLRYLPVFCIGMIIALKLDALRAWYERAHSAVRGGAWTLVGVLLFVPALFEPFAESAPLVRGEFWVLSLLGCAGLVALVTVSGRAGGFLESRGVMFFGRRSFSLYLVHEPVIVAAALLVGASAWWPWLALLPIVLLIVVGVTMAFYRFVEQPSIAASRAAGRAMVRVGERRVA